MATEQLKIVLTAETQQAQKSLQKFADTTKQTQSQLASTGKATQRLGGQVQGAVQNITGFSSGLGIAGIALIAVGTAIEKIKQRFQEFAEVVSAGAGATYKAGQEFSRWVRLANPESLKDANNALKDYGIAINNISTLQTKGAEIGALYSKIKGEEAKQQILSARAAEEYTKQILLTSAAQSGDILNTLQAVGGKNLVSNFFQQLLKGGGVVGSVNTVTGAYSDTLVDAAEKQKLWEKEIDASRRQNDLNLAVLKNIAGVTEISTDKVKDNTAELKKQQKALEERNKAIKEAKALLAVAEQAFFIQQGQDNTPIQAAPTIDEGPVKSLQEILQGTNVGELVKQFQDAKKAADELNASIQNLAVEAIAQLAANIGEAIITGDFKDVFRNFLGIIGSGLQEIGKKMIALSPIIAKLKLALATLNPALLLPAGIALVAIGAALRATVAKGVGARATGGPVTGSTPYLVGERGPELFVPGSSGRIVSNNNLMGGSGQLVARVSGSDLLFVLNKAQANRGAF